MSSSHSDSAFHVSILVDAAKTHGPLSPIWRFFGYDEPNYTYMPGGLELLSKLAELSPHPVVVRTHHLLCSGDGTPALKWGSTNAYNEDKAGQPVYDWTIIDRIFDAYVQRKMKPYVQIGFMPRALSIRPDPYQHKWRPGDPYATILGGWAYPPKDWDKWHELVRQWVTHCAQRYGKAEAESWHWALWNEPNILYWQGTQQEFFKLYDYTSHAVKSVLPAAPVGGPDSAGGGRWLADFLRHCTSGVNHLTGKTGAPLDFISFHAKGSPTFVDGHVRMGLAEQLRTIDENFAIIASFPQLRNKPVILGESDPDGCAACPATLYPQNAYRNGPLYASYTAASFARKRQLADKHGLQLQGALTWAFEFEGFPYFAGFRTLSTNGIDKPVLNVFRMFGMMNGQRLEVHSSGEVGLDRILAEGVRQNSDVAGQACIDRRSLAIMVWHYHDDDLPGPQAEVKLTVKNLPCKGPVQLVYYCIDQQHSNAYEFWNQMGCPQNLSADQYQRLKQAGQLQALQPAQSVPVINSTIELSLSLPRQAIRLLTAKW